MSKFQHPISITEAETPTNGKSEHPLSFAEVENLFKNIKQGWQDF